MTQTKQNRNEWKLNNWCTMQGWQGIQINTYSLNIQNCGLLMTVQCLQWLDIFVIAELTIATLFAWVLAMRHWMSWCWFLCFSSRVSRGLLKIHRNPQHLCCFISNTPMQYQLSSIIVMIVSREYPEDYRFLLCAQRTFCIKPKEYRLGRVHLDLDGSRDDQLGEAGLVEP